MASLLLRLVGPMQSWGTRSRFSDRDTERFPSKSGILGLVCAALGWPRAAERFEEWSMADLALLTLAVREDRPGRPATDYHTTLDVPSADAPSLRDIPASKRRTIPSHRHYLADAAFLAGLEGDRALLARLDRALRQPVWPIYLGRKGFVPGLPVCLPDGLTDAPLQERLQQYAWLGDGPRRQPAVVWVERETATGQPRWDVPLGAFATRRFGLRWVSHETVSLAGGQEALA
ncbi:MAG: type I-E CRISPR-associated protein Cas5/CasD [Armatimonadetes bacterium]|nr:type I-E CRISPR-associated protein Cas5/CasD [Armatimonadota bacterium]